MNKPLIQATNLCRFFRRGDHEVRALDHVSLMVNSGEFLAVVGASGSGKSTLLALLAGLDSPTSGHVLFAGNSLGEMSRRQLADYRASQIGMVFQSFNLLPHLTARQNVELALFFNNTPPEERRQKAGDTLAQLKLQDRLDHRPADLSGGEQQRVALARALVKKPRVLFADEPTGNLDRDHSEQIARILSDLSTGGMTIIMVTHNLDMARQYAGRHIRLHYGRIDEESS